MENLYEKFLEILEDHPEIDEMFYPWSECQVSIYEIPRVETEMFFPRHPNSMIEVKENNESNPT